MKSPAFQFYPTEYLGSQRVSLMTLEEEGAYIRLLSSCWVHGSIPSDPATIARLIGKGASTTLATTLATMFQPHPLDPSRLIHDRLESERQKQAVWREKSREGGKKSAKLRENAKGGSTTVARVVEGSLQNGSNQNPTLCLQSLSSVSISDSVSDSKTTPLAPQGGNAREGAPASEPAHTHEGEQASERPRKAAAPRPDDQTDAEWLDALAASPTYAGIDVAREFAKMEFWCSTHHKQPTRRRFIAWINRVEKPMAPARQSRFENAF